MVISKTLYQILVSTSLASHKENEKVLRIYRDCRHASGKWAQILVGITEPLLCYMDGVCVLDISKAI